MTSSGNIDVRIALHERDEDVAQAFDCAVATFGRQTQDGVWIAMNPGWDTPEGKAKSVERLAKGWRDSSKDSSGNLITSYLKATLPDENGGERVVGFAIWKQLSAVEGHGEIPADDAKKLEIAGDIYPDNETERRYLYQITRSLSRQRGAVAREKVGADHPAIMVLDLCVVDPAVQGRGIAKKLVRWGVDEAKRRGDLELVTEASAMGRGVYAKFGFQQEGPPIEYAVDAEFADRERPSNIFMRTRPARS